MTKPNSELIFISMSKETLTRAVQLAGGQVHLARRIRERLPDSKIGQVHIWGWLNSVKIEVPPADVVIPIAQALGYRMTPHQIRADLYPNPTDALPVEIAEKVIAGIWPPVIQPEQVAA